MLFYLLPILLIQTGKAAFSIEARQLLLYSQASNNYQCTVVFTNNYPAFPTIAFGVSNFQMSPKTNISFNMQIKASGTSFMVIDLTANNFLVTVYFNYITVTSDPIFSSYFVSVDNKNKTILNSDNNAVWTYNDIKFSSSKILVYAILSGWSLQIVTIYYINVEVDVISLTSFNITLKVAYDSILSMISVRLFFVDEQRLIDDEYEYKSNVFLIYGNNSTQIYTVSRLAGSVLFYGIKGFYGLLKESVSIFKYGCSVYENVGTWQINMQAVPVEGGLVKVVFLQLGNFKQRNDLLLYILVGCGVFVVLSLLLMILVYKKCGNGNRLAPLFSQSKQKIYLQQMPTLAV